MHRLIKKAKQERRHLLEPEALILLESYGIQVPPHKVIHNEAEALEMAKSIGWPIVMKVVSRDIVHKTEMGGVILDIRNEEQVHKAFSRLSSLESTEKRIEGFIIYPFIKSELELAVGMVRDSQFGPVISFGLGGVWIEIFKDITYAIAPLSSEEAMDILDSIKAHQLLKGFRNSKPVDRKAIAELLVRLYHMVMKETAIQELDLNPVFPMEKDYFIADGRIIL